MRGGVAALAGVLLLGGAARAQVLGVTSAGPARDFGYFTGDLLTAEATVRVGPGTMLDAASLPAPGPVAASLELRAVQVRRVAIAGGALVRLRLTYQTLLAPEEVRPVDVPGFRAVFVQGGQRIAAQVPGFRVSVSPFRHDVKPVIDASQMRPDAALAGEDAGPARRVLAAGLGLAAAGGIALGWLGGWLRVRRAHPFRAAAREVARAADARAATLALHRAFDAAAAARLLADDVDGFVARHPAFAGLRGEIGAFFARSREMFFGGGGGAELSELARLSRKLARAERRA